MSLGIDEKERLAQAYHRTTGDLRLGFDPGTYSWSDDRDILKGREDAALAFGESVGSWPAFGDSSAALGRLKALGLKLVILSNVDNHSFAE